MNRQHDWTQLRDGATLHAEQLLQLADDAYAAAASSASAVGGAGCLVSPSADASEAINRIEFDNEARCVELDNVHVLTRGGFCAVLPPPRKSFVLPADGRLRCLNLYARPFTSSSGVTDAVWEEQPPKSARGVCLVEWLGERFRLVPLPYTVSALAPLRAAFSELLPAAQTLYQLLVLAPPTSFARIGLLPPERGELGALGVALERVSFLSPATPLNVASPLFLELANEMYGWFCFAAARRSGRDAVGLTADLLSRRALVHRGNLPVPSYAQSLVLQPSDGSTWIELVEALARSLTGFARLLQGERDEDTLQPIERFEPDLWPDGLGLRYALPEAGGQLKMRCDLSHAIEPLLLWGIGPRSEVPHLRSAPLDTLQPGRYEANIGPLSVPAGQDLVLVADSSEVVVSVSLSR